MAELQRILESNGAFKSEMMQAYLSNAENFSSTGNLNSSTTGNMNSCSTSTLPPDVNLNMQETTTANITSGVNLNQGCNLNENKSANFLSRQSTDNMPSPLILDNMDSRSTTGGTNLNQMTNLNQQQQQSRSSGSPTNLNLISSGSIKQKIDTVTIKQDSATEDPNANKDIDIDRTLAEVREAPSESRRLLIDQVTDAIVEAHMGTTVNTYANIAEANERISKNPPMPMDMPDMSKLSLSSSMMMQHFMSSMKPEIAKVINFCKKLPGFCEVDQEDQVRLIKQGSFEVMVARVTMLIDEVNETMLDPSLKMKSPRSVIQGMPLGPFLDQFFEVAGRFNPLRLTDGEIGLYTAILMICPTRQDLRDVSAITTIQNLYLQALYSLLKQNHKDFEKTFSTLIDMIPTFRKINDDHNKFINSMKMKSPEDFDRFPQLHKEVFEVPPSPAS